jgi:hypothetical protein
MHAHKPGGWELLVDLGIAGDIAGAIAIPAARAMLIQHIMVTPITAILIVVVLSIAATLSTTL